MDHSTPGLPVHHQLPESTQTHVHWVSDAIQPSHLSSPFPPAFNLCQHQGLFQWVRSLHQVAKVLEFQLQHQLVWNHRESGNERALRKAEWRLAEGGCFRVFQRDFLTYFFVVVFFFLQLVACRILVPWPGIKSGPPALGAWSLNYWTTGGVLELPHFNSFYPHKPWDQGRGYTIKWVYSNYLGTTKMNTRWIHGPSGPIVSQTLPRLNIYYMTPAIVGGMMKL